MERTQIVDAAEDAAYALYQQTFSDEMIIALRKDFSEEVFEISNDEYLDLIDVAYVLKCTLSVLSSDKLEEKYNLWLMIYCKKQSTSLKISPTLNLQEVCLTLIILRRYYYGGYQCLRYWIPTELKRIESKSFRTCYEK